MTKESSQRKSTHPLAIAILIGSSVIAVGLIISSLITYLGTQDKKDKDPKKVYENIGYVKIDKSPVLGDKDAPVTIIEYTDFDCPICKLASDEVMPPLKKDYIEPGKVRFIFKSLPIQLTHPMAFRKTEAAYCARDVGGDNAFFAYYDSLFEHFGFTLNLDQTLIDMSAELGLDTEKFKSCLIARKYKDMIDGEVLEANLIDSQGTPTWLVGKSDGTGLKDTIKVNGLIEYSYFRKIIDRHLEELQ